jgi:hypothetical protein
MDTIKTRENIREKFVSNAVEHSKAIASGDHKKANKLHMLKFYIENLVPGKA